MPQAPHKVAVCALILLQVVAISQVGEDEERRRKERATRPLLGQPQKDTADLRVFCNCAVDAGFEAW